MTLATVLWIVAVILVIAGLFAIFRKQVIWGCADRGRSLGRPRRRQHLHLTLDSTGNHRGRTHSVWRRLDFGPCCNPH